MNRSQKKCLIVSASIHSLLLVILLVGPAFFKEKEPPDLPTIEILDLSKVLITDEPISRDGGDTQPTPAPPPPAPPVRTVVQQPTPPAPRPEPPKPAPRPDPEPPKQITKAPVPVEKPKEPHKIKVNTDLIKRPTTTPSKETTQQEKTVDTQKTAQQINQSIAKIQRNLSSTTEVDYTGASGPAIANYAQIVKSKYEIAWQPPDDTSSDDAVVKVTVTIARDGTVVSATVLRGSGDSSVDASVRRTLERVKFIAPFPAGVKEQQRTFTINFNLKAKRLLG